jgi:hypothetical protein
VSGHHLDDDTLRRAFESLADSTAAECDPEDLDRIWLAVAGQLPAVERRDLVDRIGTNPELAAAWRAAHELQRGLFPAGAAGQRRGRWRCASWLAAAAALVLAFTVVIVSRRDRPAEDIWRAPDRYAIEALVTADAALPRDAFRLGWSPGPKDARYQVRVTTEDLRVLSTAVDLIEPAFAIDRALLEDLPPGSRVFWQVEATLPSGERETSPTFVVRVQ